VRVSGSKFIPAEQYTIKLEGAELVGHQALVIGSVRDPFIIRQIDDWLTRLNEKMRARVQDV
jgi:phage FluMu protein gp41